MVLLLLLGETASLQNLLFMNKWSQDKPPSIVEGPWVSGSPNMEY
jgi:hypothetical protein